MHCVNIPTISIRKIARGNIRARVTLSHNATTRLRSASSLTNNNGTVLASKTKLKGVSNLKSKFIHTLNLIGLKSQNNADISATLILSGVFHARLKSNSNLSIPYTEKLGGSFDAQKYTNFTCKEKLYPTQDVISTSGNNYFVNQDLQSSGLYNSIDEGIIAKQYDEKTTYIQPWSIYTSGNFKYKFKVDTPYIRPKESFLLLRASAPFRNYSSKTAPLYSLSNIRFEDPSGNLIVKYKDFSIRGDADYDQNYVNFATYITEPEINNSSLDTWNNNYPLLGSGTTSGNYTVNLDISISSLDDPFNDGYDEGYQDFPSFQTLLNSGNNYLALDGAPLSTQNDFINPTNSLRITAIELCNSGELASFRNQYLKIYTDVSATGLRITRNIFPNQVLTSNSYNEIYPSADSTWIYQDLEANVYTNITTSGANRFPSLLRDGNNGTNVQLTYSSIQDSGKLKLRFAHEPPVPFDGYSDGAFSFGLLRPVKETNRAKWSNITEADSFFTIDKVDLVVVAKKASGSRNYSLDIVGYSDDKLLHVTSQVGGFLQNLENSGVSTVPTSSGFYNTDSFGISSETLSDKSQYYQNNLTNNSGGDHYLLSTYPVINSTTFQEYTIPLKIYDDRVSIGKSTDYSMSSYFENLYLDIYPIPSGASIANIKLVVSYKPSNGLMLHTIGQADKEFTRRRLRLLPNGDTINSSGSLVSNIPQAYTRDSTLKNNYGRRWKKAYESLFAGPYNPKDFDFSFYNPQMYSPFINGYFSFVFDSGNSIIADYSYDRSRLDSVVSGSYVGKYEKINNLGLRFNSSSLFNSSTSNKTIDWTRISGYENHELYNRLSDNFENAVRVSGNLGYINFGNVNTSNGFAVYGRFSPDINISGVGYNLWNSGVLFSKYDSGNNLEFIVGFNSGKLIGRARDSSGNIISVNDSKYYYEYTYPLDVMLSYNENDNKLRLFTNDLRDTSSTFVLHSGNSNLTFGYSSGSGIGINGFFTNIGISTNSGINILSSGNEDISNKQLLYSKFNTNLYSSINQYIENWHLGAFKICAFNEAYDRFTHRDSSGILIHQLNHHGSGYSQFTNLSLPSNIITSGISYHTQIENDFIRLNLQDTSEANPNFYTAYPRISKTLPRGYSFMDEAFAVDTIINYETHNDILWSDGNVGPKLIVSLYTPNKEPKSYPTTNYGLINRYTHYLKPSGCYEIITSKFDFNSLIDESEPWAKFNKDQYLNEFNHKYFSKDVDDMFLQYDLVFPSGKPFESILKIYGVNVRLEDALVTPSSIYNNLNISVSGEQVTRSSVNLSMPNIIIPSSDYINLYANANISGVSIENINLLCSGAYFASGYMPLHSITVGSLTSSEQTFGLFGSNPNFGLNLYTSGQLFREEDLSLFTKNNLIDQSASGTISLVSFNRLDQDTNTANLNLRIRAVAASINRIPNATTSLYLKGPENTPINSTFNLYISSFDPKNITTSLSLFTVNLPTLDIELGNQVVYWDNKNVGVNIDVGDNSYATLSANDEIRGVELICFGGCN